MVSRGVWYKERGRVVKNEPQPLIDDLDSLPFPAWELLPYHKYDGGETNRKGMPFLTILTSRGCPYGCYYCPYPVAQGRKWRARSSENVVEELEYLIKGLGAKTILFRDPEFTLDRKRTMEICEKIMERGLRFAWRCETRIDHLDEELIVLMGKAGCFGINLGIESVNEEVLMNLERRPFPLEKAIEIVNACKINDIEAYCFFIIGLPGDTKESINKMVDFAIKLKPPFVQFTVATPYPGTKLESWARERGYIQNNFTLEAITGSVPIMRNEHLTVKEIEKLRRMAYQRFNLETKGINDVYKRALYHIRHFNLPRLLHGCKTYCHLLLNRLLHK
jgi:radical SAM superfamily enzyme YgiQ (UPF0313 family)